MLTYLVNKCKKNINYISNKRNRRLLLLCIFEKWNPIAIGCNIERGIYDDPLCKKYREDNCNGCPIQKRTGKNKCIDTPYTLFSNKRFCELGRCVYIEDEIEFLISLLDKETQENLENIFINWCKTGKL